MYTPRTEIHSRENGSDGSLVSIIVPVYNVEKYFTKCIESIVNQTYSNLEIILIDDGSTDKSYEICKEYAAKDSRIILERQKNSGVGYSRNKAVDMAKGEYILFIDSDDFVDLNYVKSLVENAVGNDLVICGYVSLSKNESKEVKANVSTITGNFTEDHYNLYHVVAGPVVKLYRKENFHKYNLRFNEEHSYSEDRVFNYYYLSCTNKYRYVDKVLYYYVHHESPSLSKSKSKKSFEDALFALQEERRFLENIKAKYISLQLSDSAAMYLRGFYKVSDGDNSIKGFTKRAKRIREILENYYSYTTWKKTIILYCLKNEWYMLLYWLFKVNKLRLKITGRG